MKSRDLLPMVACVCAVAIALAYFESGSSASSGPVSREGVEWQVDPDKIRQYPRDAIPRNWQGTWFTPDDYPSVAEASGMEGSVSTMLRIDPSGEVSDCVITKSSRVLSIDRRVCAALSTRARFYPALDDRQEPVAGEFNTTVVLTMPELRNEQQAEIIADVSKDGEIQSCEWGTAAHPVGNAMPVCEVLVARARSEDSFAVGRVPLWIASAEALAILSDAKTRR